MSLRELSKADLITLLEIIQDCLACPDNGQLLALLRRTKDLLGAECAAMLNVTHNRGTIENPEYQPVVFPKGLAELYLKDKHYERDPLIFDQFAQSRATTWAEAAARFPMIPVENGIEIAFDHGLLHGLVYGEIRGQKHMNGFTFAAPDARFVPRHVAILDALGPHLHRAWRRCKQFAPASAAELSPREVEVLKWVGAGKTNWETAHILSISENTVKGHLSKILEKMNVRNRQQAVVMAMEKGIIKTTPKSK